jgi:hypothetical protein
MEELLPEGNYIISFSKNCCTGLVGDKCQCWRCRKVKGLEPDEDLAREIKDNAEAEHKISMRKFLRDSGINP